MKNNPDLLQEADLTNAGSYLTEDSIKINEDIYNMSIPMKEDQDTVKYQKTLKVDVENIAKKNI